jgi:GT2 family glycosyltransferase
MNETAVTIIIPSYNAKQTVVACLNSVLNQTVNMQYEVIVVDSSSDGTQEIIKEKFPQIKLMHLEDKVFPGRARNIGIKNSQGKFIAFIDADCVAERDWLENLLSCHRKSDYAAVGGSIKNGTPKNIVGTIGYLTEFNEFTERQAMRLVDFIPTCNACYRRNVFNTFGLFLTDIFPSEDSIFGWNIVKGGEKIFFFPKAQVTHLNKTDLRHFIKHQFILGKASALARKKTNLPGQIFIHIPVLTILLPFIRFVRAIYRQLRSRDFEYFAILISFSPLYLFGVGIWTLGFWKGITLRD